MQNPELVSHILMVSSLEHDTKKSPPGMNSTEETSCSWPYNVLNTVEVYKFHSFIVMSVEQEAKILPFGWYAM